MLNVNKVSIDLSTVDAFDSFTPLPPGKYPVEISGLEIRISKAGNQVLNIEFSITEPTYKNRKVFDGFTLGNEIAMKRLKTMLIAAESPESNFLTDINNLIGLSLTVQLKVEDAGYGLQNRITRFLEKCDKDNPVVIEQLKMPRGDKDKPVVVEQLKMPFD